ncbi:hypothetical protein BO94DRAFT_574160 [Aspergillus sclerotioniger CBS 115572]|uniref:Uncharacterized protein n=1 Tax=Aspergillus sclerotioniger CBS 115572 TaxID=1450535 RepID=A0A317WVK8_9EURO|nr:hypothetical protein BO94DRAFT_574160 [Aspergillus sclerotioniger CBS 115572]PWY90396.1 hypothetical protein BO94DRAFT_574160 [Aspergillus sclerotioniger CBS 115572]
MKTEDNPSSFSPIYPSAMSLVSNPYSSPTTTTNTKPTRTIKKRSASPTPLISPTRAPKRLTTTTTTPTSPTTQTKTHLLTTLKSLITELELESTPTSTTNQQPPWTTTAITLLQHAEKATDAHLISTMELALEVQKLRTQAMEMNAEVKALGRRMVGLVRGCVELESRVWDQVERDPGGGVREVVRGLVREGVMDQLNGNVNVNGVGGWMGR